VIQNKSADEDYAGRSDNERLVAESIKGAEHDQMRQANLKREQIWNKTDFKAKIDSPKPMSTKFHQLSRAQIQPQANSWR